MAQGNPNPVNKFTIGNKFGSIRKRKVVSEKMLREALYRSGKEALIFLEDVFKSSEIEIKHRIQAASSWSKLVFLQPKEETGESITDVKLTAEQHAEFDKFLIEVGVPKENIGTQKQIMIKASEFLKKICDSQEETEIFEEE